MGEVNNSETYVQRHKLYSIMFSGDDHLSCLDKGQHNDYGKECLYYQHVLTELAKQYNIDYWLKSGDFTYGKFNKLEFRDAVDDMLDRQAEVVPHRYMLKGNHDTSNKGMTEYEYYLKKGKFNGSTSLQIGNVHIEMLDFYRTEALLKAKSAHMREAFRQNTINGGVNILFVHGYFAFKDSTTAYLGEPIIIDEMSEWFGVDYIIAGHIHERYQYNGSIVVENEDEPGTFISHKCSLHYIPCLSRPAYYEKGNAETGSVVVVDVYDNGDVEYKEIEIDLLPLAESFNLERIRDEKSHDENTHVKLDDIVENLQKMDRGIGNPEDVILGLKLVDMRYREKAVALLREADN